MVRKSCSGAREVLITGGAGFIGSNLVARLLQQPGIRVTLFDTLSRRGTEHNIEWLKGLQEAKNLRILLGDVRDLPALSEAARAADEIYHLAAQVAVTTSIADPREDFEINAAGTLNVLEAARRSGRRPMVLFTSTNKVYGGLESVAVEAAGTRFRAVDSEFRGADETTPLDFHSPYGCSKGAADQYVRDYARIYDLPTVVFRMSCIAGPRQFGNEDQGWVAHFLYSVLAGRPISIYGNGLQVRDLLHVDDLLDAMEAARANLHRTAGEVYNVGGGPERARSIREMLAEIEHLSGLDCRCAHADVRPGDQPLYVSDTGKLTQHTGWQPSRGVSEILADIRSFWQSHRHLILAQTAAAPRLSSEELVPEEVA